MTQPHRGILDERPEALVLGKNAMDGLDNLLDLRIGNRECRLDSQYVPFVSRWLHDVAAFEQPQRDEMPKQAMRNARDQPRTQAIQQATLGRSEFDSHDEATTADVAHEGMPTQ